MTEKQALEQILEIVRRYLPPDSPLTAKGALSEIIAIVDPWPVIDPDLLDTSKEAGK